MPRHSCAIWFLTSGCRRSFVTTCKELVMGMGSGMRATRAIRSAAVLTLETLEGRRLLSGDFDPTFGGAGHVTTTFTGPSQDLVSTATKLASGKMVVVGSGASGATVARYNADGSLDGSFGTGGVAFVNPSLMGSANAVVEEPATGKLILGGGAGQQGSFVRLNANGTIDTTFGTNGATFDNLPDTIIDGVMLDGSGQVAGLVHGAGAHGPFAAVHLNANGTLDTGFGGGAGYAAYDFPYSPGGDTAYAIANHNGSILIAGVSSEFFIPPNQSGTTGGLTGQDASFVQFT